MQGLQARVLRALLRLDLALQVDEHRLAGLDVALEHMPGAFQHHRFAGQHDGAVRAAAHAQRADAVRVAEGQHTMAGNQRDHGVGAADALVHLAHGGEHIVHLQRLAARGLLQLVRHHVEQHLGVALGVDVAMVGVEQLGLERVRIGQVAVVHQHDAEGRIDVERLRLFLAEGVAGRRVARLAQAAVARQRAHVAGAKHVLHHALGLVHEELAILLRHDAGRILPAVLQQQQRVIDQLIDRCVADNADDSTHSSIQFRAGMDRPWRSIDSRQILSHTAGSTGLSFFNTHTEVSATSESRHQACFLNGVISITTGQRQHQDDRPQHAERAPQHPIHRAQAGLLDQLGQAPDQQPAQKHRHHEHQHKTGNVAQGLGIAGDGQEAADIVAQPLRQHQGQQPVQHRQHLVDEATPDAQGDRGQQRQRQRSSPAPVMVRPYKLSTAAGKSSFLIFSAAVRPRPC